MEPVTASMNYKAEALRILERRVMRTGNGKKGYLLGQ